MIGVSSKGESASSCSIFIAASFCSSVKALRFFWEITFSMHFSFICWLSVLVSSLTLLSRCFPAKYGLLLVWQFGSTCFSLYETLLSIDFSCITGRETIYEMNSSFRMTSFFFINILVLDVFISNWYLKVTFCSLFWNNHSICNG